MEEKEMKRLGEEKVKNEIFSKKTKNPGQTKRLGSSQIGQQMLLDETLKIAPTIWQWINEGTWNKERREWIEIFKDEKTTSSLIMSCMMLMVGRISLFSEGRSLSGLNRGFKAGRYKIIEKVDRMLFDNRLGFNKAFRLVEQIVDLSTFFVKEDKMEINGDSIKHMIKYDCTLFEDIASELSVKAAETFYPLPLTTKPKMWKSEDNTIKGGYSSYQYDMIRIRSGDKKVDYSQYSNKIFKALNYIQSVRWRVNEDILNQIEEDLKQPKKEDYFKTSYPNVKDYNNMTEEQKDQLNLYNAEKGDFESAIGKWRSVKMALDIAKKYIGKDVYFPHNYDFRGRVYPLPIGLSPQGSDPIKAMIEFAEGEVLNKDGEDWCWAYLASLYGDDKLHFPHRVARGKELIDADYKEADEPYQFLAHQMELQKYVLNKDYPVKTRIHLDACNSGLN